MQAAQAIRGWRGDSLALVAGGLVTLSLAPFGLWPLGILSCALLHWLLGTASASQGLRQGWWYGVGLFGSGVSWVYVSIHIYGAAPVPLAALLTLLFCLGLALLPAITAWCYVRWVRDSLAGQTLGFAALWLLAEWVRSWLLTGFPWLYLGYAHLHSPLAGWAPWIGVFGVGFLVAFSGATLSHWLSRRRAPRGALVTVAILWLAGAGLTLVDWGRPAGDPLRVALVQANIPQSVKWDPEQYWPTLRLYESLSKPLWAGHDLVVWPEAAIPGFYQGAQGFLDQQAERARERGATLIVGTPYRAGESHYHNSVIALGVGSGIFHKQHLVPFGEFVPLEHWLRGLIAFFDLPMSSFSPGPAQQQALRINGVTLGPSICYEVVYPQQVSQWMPAADILITLSNDAWFGRSIGPLQHLEIARFRALESARPMIRATGSGVTALIDHRGRIQASLPQFTQEVLSGTVTPRQGITPYILIGHQPLVLLAAIWLLLARRQRQH